MAAFISDPQTSFGFGLFALASSESLDITPSSGNGFKFVMSELGANSPALTKPPLFSQASTHLLEGKTLPLVVELPIAVDLTTPTELSSLDIEQLSFSAEALGLPVPEILSAMAQMTKSQPMDIENTPVVAKELADIEPSDEHDRAVLLGDLPLDQSIALDIKASEAMPFTHDRLSLSQSVLNTVQVELIDENDGKEIDISQSEELKTLSDGPLGKLSEEELRPFLQAWLEEPMTIEAIGEDGEPGLESTTVGQLIALYPEPRNWHAITMNVISGEEGHSTERDLPHHQSLLKIVTDKALTVAKSDQAFELMPSRFQQSEALTQQYLRHFTSLMKSEVSPESGMLKESVAVDPSATARVSAESLKMMQALLAQNVSAPMNATVNKTIIKPVANVDVVTTVSATPTSTATQSIINDSAGTFVAERASLSLHRGELQQHIEQRIQWMLSKGLQRADIRVDPPELGSIHIRIAQQGDQTQVIFTSQHAAVRDALENTLPRLREMFEQQGLSLAQSDVRDQGGQSHRQSEHNTHFELGQQSEVQQDEPLSVAISGIGLVDTHV